jgi:glutaminase
MNSRNNAALLRSPIEEYLNQLHRKYAGLGEGKVADYIPELGKANPDWFGICIATRDGHVYEVGDTRQHFTIQSISKALAYGLALEERGEDYILSKIGVEPSGDAFNAISLKPGAGTPMNPMINAGAIATDGQVLPKDGKSRLDRVLGYLSACAGRTLDIDEAVYRSESETGHRNRAIGWMLRNFEVIDVDPTDILETYFQQCAIRVTCRDLALMGATLANHGRHPLTREQAIAPEYVHNILSVMASCGMYDFSGEWLYRVGLPAKSGVGGGILAVLPGQLGIGIFSPPLDEQGNSARGIRVCSDLSRDLALHVFANGVAPPPCLRLSSAASQITSRRRRVSRLHQLLRSSGHRIRVFELQGELIFATLEPVLRMALKQAPYCRYLVLNLKNVVSIDDVSIRFIVELRQKLEEGGIELLACNSAKFVKRLTTQGFGETAQFHDEDTALEFCENGLLKELVGDDWNDAGQIALADTYLLSGLPPDDLDWLDREMSSHTSEEGDVLLSAGDEANQLFILLSGSVVVRLASDWGGPDKRLDVFVAGMTFGEMGFLDGSPRSADIVALEPVVYRAIDRDLFKRLETEHPLVKIRLLERISRQLSSNLRRANTEAAAYRG